MHRITITLDDPLVEELETFMAERAYANRSEAIRDMIRTQLDARQLEQTPEGACIANLTYVFNHHERELASRLTRAHHDHHDLSVATLHVHLDHDNCMETVVLRGSVAQVRAFADELIAQPGVRHGKLTLLPVRMTETSHVHGIKGKAHRHTHLEPII